MPTSTITSKGQITIPKPIRDQLRLQKGHRVEFFVEAGGRVVLTPRNADVRALKGSIRSRRRRAPSLGEINAAIARGYSRR